MIDLRLAPAAAATWAATWWATGHPAQWAWVGACALAALGCALEVVQKRESGREAEGVSLLGQRLPGSLFLQLSQVGVIEVKHRFIHKSHWGDSLS